MIIPHFNNIENALISYLKDAKKEIKIAVCWFTNTNLFDVVCEKLEKNVKVELIIINDSVNNRFGGLDFERFILLGGKFYFGSDRNLMHNKVCIIDGNTLITGSYNWTFYAENKNVENIVIIQEEKHLIDSYVSEFDRIKKGLKLVKEYDREKHSNALDVFSIINYLSSDIYYQSSLEKSRGNFDSAKILAQKSKNIDPKNKAAAKLIDAIEFEKTTSVLLKAIEESRHEETHTNWI